MVWISKYTELLRKQWKFISTYMCPAPWSVKGSMSLEIDWKGKMKAHIHFSVSFINKNETLHYYF